MTQISFPRNFWADRHILETSAMSFGAVTNERACQNSAISPIGQIAAAGACLRQLANLGQLAKMAVAAAGREVLFGAAAAPACVAPIASVALRVASMFPVMAVQPAF